LAAVVTAAWLPATAWAAFFGVTTEGANADSSASGNVLTDFEFYSDGGEGVLFSSLSENDGRGEARAMADIDGNPSGPVPTPVVKAFSDADLLNLQQGAATADAGALVEYVYSGPDGFLSYNYDLTGTVTEPTDTNAWIVAEGALLTEVEFFDTNLLSFAEGGALEMDSFSEEQFTAGSADASGSLELFVSDGDVFSLLISLSTLAAKEGAVADASSTLTGSFEVPAGGSLSVVPEPASLTLLGLGGLALLRRRSLNQ
jgi:hypothetical protein